MELQKISGISKINNFLFAEDSLQAWRTYAIGPGKTKPRKRFQVSVIFGKLKK